MEGPHSPAQDYPGVTALPPAADDATKVIWQDPTSYNPYFHGPPYLPGMQVRLERTAAMNTTKDIASRIAHMAGHELPAILTLLRALGVIHQTHHWLTAGKTSYADHLLFERIYNDIAGEDDSVAERAVGTGSPPALLHPSLQAHQMAEVIEALTEGATYGEGESPDSYVATSIKAERWFVACMKQIAEAMKAAGTLSRGMDNLLAGIEDKHEEHIYLLSQRGKTASTLWKAAGEGDEEKAKKAFVAWIDDLVKKAQDAKKELLSKENPGRAASEFIGTMKGYTQEDWYEVYYR
jgi:DNA-binding ferritin-like protein